jgi:flagellar biosynthetic protein FliO
LRNDEAGVSRSGRRTLILCLVLLIGGGWISISARSANQKAQPATPQQRSGSFLADPNFASTADISLGGGGLFARMMLCIVLVVGLGVGMLYVSKRLLPKVTTAPGKEIRILETAYLGPRKALHLVEVGNHRLLIGSTNDGITSLADVSDTWMDIPKQEHDDAVRL